MCSSDLSQDICFVPTGGYAKVVEKLRPGAVRPGDIVHVDGTVMGRHDGVINYTVGQRKGLGIGGRKTPAGDDVDPLYVVRVDPVANQVVVGPRAALARDKVMVRELNWLGAPAVGVPMPVSVKLRSAQSPAPALLVLHGDGNAVVELETAQYGISPGQAAVFYDGERMLGGGWISGTGQR